MILIKYNIFIYDINSNLFSLFLKNNDFNCFVKCLSEFHDFMFIAHNNQRREILRGRQTLKLAEFCKAVLSLNATRSMQKQVHDVGNNSDGLHLVLTLTVMKCDGKGAFCSQLQTDHITLSHSHPLLASLLESVGVAILLLFSFH